MNKTRELPRILLVVLLKIPKFAVTGVCRPVVQTSRKRRLATLELKRIIPFLKEMCYRLFKSKVETETEFEYTSAKFSFKFRNKTKVN